jgi:hypothetical protein
MPERARAVPPRAFEPFRLDEQPPQAVFASAAAIAQGMGERRIAGHYSPAKEERAPIPAR